MKTVIYIEAEHLVIGQAAHVRPLNHPDVQNVLNGRWATTSAVQEIFPDGKTFRTKNTLYRPLPDLAPGESITSQEFDHATL